MGPKPQLRPSHISGSASRYISHCSRCGRGIFDWQPHEWSREPLGLSHVSCPPIAVVAR